MERIENGLRGWDVEVQCYFGASAASRTGTALSVCVDPRSILSEKTLLAEEGEMRLWMALEDGALHPETEPDRLSGRPGLDSEWDGTGLVGA
jgi:hypothetical protein